MRILTNPTSENEIREQINELNKEFNNLELQFQKTKRDKESELQFFTETLDFKKEEMLFDFNSRKQELETEITNLEISKDQIASAILGIQGALTEKENLLDEREINLSEREDILEMQIQSIKERESNLILKETDCLYKENYLNQRKTNLESKVKIIARELDDREVFISLKEKELRNREAEIIKKEEQLKHEEYSLQIRELINRDKSKEVSILNTQVMDKRRSFEQTYKELNWKK